MCIYIPWNVTEEDVLCDSGWYQLAYKGLVCSAAAALAPDRHASTVIFWFIWSRNIQTNKFWKMDWEKEMSNREWKSNPRLGSNIAPVKIHFFWYLENLCLVLIPKSWCAPISHPQVQTSTIRWKQINANINWKNPRSAKINSPVKESYTTVVASNYSYCFVIFDQWLHHHDETQRHFCGKIYGRFLK